MKEHKQYMAYSLLCSTEDAASLHQDGFWIKAQEMFRLEQSWLFYFTHFNHSISNAINKIVAAHINKMICFKIRKHVVAMLTKPNK